MRPEPYTLAALGARGPEAATEGTKGGTEEGIDEATVGFLVDPTSIGPGDVLVLRALGLGDALTGIPALRGLRRLLPDHRLLLAAPAAVGSWLCRLGVVDGLLALPGLLPLPPMPGGHVAVDLHGRGPRSQLALLATRPSHLLAFDCPQAGHRGPTWRLDEHEVRRWCRLVRDAGGDCGPADLRLRPRPTAPANGPVVLHPGAAFASRRWPVSRWQEVARSLADAGHPVVVTGSEHETALCGRVVEDVPNAVSHAGRSSLDELAGLVASARLVVSGDTGTAHVATAFATASVLLFGPTPPAWWGPLIDPDLHTVLWHGSAADDHGDPHGAEIDARLARVEVREVLVAARAALSSGRSRTVSSSGRSRTASSSGRSRTASSSPPCVPTPRVSSPTGRNSDGSPAELTPPG